MTEKKGVLYMANKKDVSRRDFLKVAGVATGSVIGGGLIGGLIGYNVKKPNGQTGGKHEGHGGDEFVSPTGRMFFVNNADFQTLSAATERIFPKDDLGPGAIELRVPYFIDNQLAGSYGNNTKEYMQGPFAEGTPTQGYQGHLNRADIFLRGIRAIQQVAKKEHDSTFNKLEDEQKDVLLTKFQKGEVSIPGVDSSYFFKLLRTATLNGAYADPIYAGNANMDGWRMKGFPGHQMTFKNEIEDDTFHDMEPASIASMNH